MSDKKTRELEKKEDWFCPIHKKPVTARVRTKLDAKTGKSKYAGEYFACPQYWSGCGYYVSPGMDGKTIVKVIEAAS